MSHAGLSPRCLGPKRLEPKWLRREVDVLVAVLAEVLVDVFVEVLSKVQHAQQAC